MSPWDGLKMELVPGFPWVLQRMGLILGFSPGNSGDSYSGNDNDGDSGGDDDGDDDDDEAVLPEGAGRLVQPTLKGKGQQQEQQQQQQQQKQDQHQHEQQP